MRAVRIVAIAFIFMGASLAWVILGASVSSRTDASLRELHEQVAGLWGSELNQYAPTLTIQETETYYETDDKGKRTRKTRLVYTQMVPDSSEVKVSLKSDIRRKGLLWYRTYAVEFDADYTVTHECTREPYLVATFRFPSSRAMYDDFQFAVNAKEFSGGSYDYNEIKNSIALPPGETGTVHVHYKSRGLDDWTYRFGDGITEVKNCHLVVDTDYERINFPPGSMSPTEKKETAAGWELTWEFKKLISGFNIGVEMPEQPNAGTMATRISYFAPVGLLFYITVLVIIGAIRGQNLHPMHYFFIAGGFFAFHLLMAYLADHIEIRLTFAICAVVSVLLVVTYLIRVIGAGFTLKVAAPAQLIFLVLFSYTFFFKGYTGLAITVASIITLGVLMHITAKVDWEKLTGPPETVLKAPQTPPQQPAQPPQEPGPPTQPTQSR